MTLDEHIDRTLQTAREILAALKRGEIITCTEAQEKRLRAARDRIMRAIEANTKE